MDKSFQEQLEYSRKESESTLKWNQIEIGRKKAALEKAIKNNDETEINRIKQYLLYIQDLNYILEKTLHELRLPYFSDIEEREEIAKNFPKEVDEVISENDPIFFHGIGNIGIVEDILRDGALKTQKDRGYIVSFSSYMICVTPKNNIGESLDIAGSGNDYSKPYGALFVIAPTVEEFKVFESGIKTKSLLCYIKSTNFRENPDKLVAVITSNENLERLRRVAKESGIDENKIMNHASFIEMYKQKIACIPGK